MTHTIKSNSIKALSLLFTLALVLGMFSIPANAATSGITLSGTCHVQDYGDTAGVWDASTGILTLGTRGQAKRVEAITINLTNDTGYSGSLKYRVHVQDIGWQDYRSAGEMAGTSGQAKRLEGIEMELTGDLAAYYTVEYAVHIQDYGDAQGFVSDGALAGTTGESKRLEEVQVRIVPRGQGTSTTVNYRVHRQDYGWESTWAKNGAESGTTGQSKRLEGIEIHLTGNQYSGSIEYRTHVQNIGWESTWSKDGEMSGTQGMSYRLEGIEIKLTGDISNYYDVYYRVHAQDYGWLGWAKNGEMSGTSGMSKRLEAIQIVLVAKNGAAPGNVAGVTSIMTQPSVVDGTPTSPAGDQPATDTTILPNGNTRTVTHSYDVIASCDGIDFALAQTTVKTTFSSGFTNEKVYADKVTASYASSGPNNTIINGYQGTSFGIYVSGDIDYNGLYVKYNGDEGYRDIGNSSYYIQYIPDIISPIASIETQYYEEPTGWFYLGTYDQERFEYMKENGYTGCFIIEALCSTYGKQDFDVYYKGNKITTLSAEAFDEDLIKGETLVAFPEAKTMYADIIQYKANMSDLDLISAGCYWIRNHSYRDYDCWSAALIRQMMMMRGHVGITLSCAVIEDGYLVSNDYGNYYAVTWDVDQGIGHRIDLTYLGDGKYVTYETQGSLALAKGETDFGYPWADVGEFDKFVYSIYDDADWLIDYDNVYEMFLGDFGIDITTFDPYDCTTWYT